MDFKEFLYLYTKNSILTAEKRNFESFTVSAMPWHGELCRRDGVGIVFANRKHSSAAGNIARGGKGGAYLKIQLISCEILMFSETIFRIYRRTQAGIEIFTLKIYKKII